MDEGFNVCDFLKTDEMTDEQINRCEFWTTANRLVRNSQKHNFQGERIQVNHEWDLDKMKDWLQGYEDKQVIDYLRYGWPLNNKDTYKDTEVPVNQSGARENPEEVRAYLNKEIEAGSVIGPFSHKPVWKCSSFLTTRYQAKKRFDRVTCYFESFLPLSWKLGEQLNR